MSAPSRATRTGRAYLELRKLARERTAQLIERRGDGSPLLGPDHEILSDEGQVFRDDEFAAHLERLAASEDNLPTDPPA